MRKTRLLDLAPSTARRMIYVGLGIAVSAAVVWAGLATYVRSATDPDSVARPSDATTGTASEASGGAAVTSGAPSGAPTRTPTRTKTPTSTGTIGGPPPPPPGSTTCPLPKYPSPACTGVPARTVFSKTVNGDYNARVAGQVIDKWHITGNLNIKAPNVVIKNTQIDRSVFNRFGPGSNSQTNTYPYTISDSTIGPATGCIRAAGLQEANYTAARVHIRGVDHGVDMSEPGHVLVRDSYLVMCWLPPSVTPPDGSHVDGIQAYCPEGLCTDVQLLHNTFDMRPDGKGTFVINMNDPHISAVTVNNNLLAGGDNYVIVAEWRSGPDFIFHGNRVVNNTWGGASPASAEGTCGHQRWQDNKVVEVDGNYGVTKVVRDLPCAQ
jgi:hypothetical protein